MATVAPKALPHIHALLTTPSQTEERSPTPVALSPSQTYWGDRRGLLFWFACASLLVALHFAQHVYYLLR